MASVAIFQTFQLVENGLISFYEGVDGFDCFLVLPGTFLKEFNDFTLWSFVVLDHLLGRLGVLGENGQGPIEFFV